MEISEDRKNEWLNWVKDRAHLISLYMVSCLEAGETYVGSVDENGNVMEDEPNPDFVFLSKCLVRIQERNKIDEEDIDKLNKLYKKWKHEFFEVQGLNKTDVVHLMDEDVMRIWDDFDPQKQEES